MTDQDRFVDNCSGGDLERARRIFARGDVGVDRKSRFGGTALCAACYYGHLHIVRWLIESLHADPNTPEYNGFTPFSRTLHRCLAVAQYMLAHGADPRAQNKYGETPFWIACYLDKPRAAQWLALTVGVGDDVARASYEGSHASGGASPLQMCRSDQKLAAWLGSFLQRRILIALWSAGRTRERRGLPGPGSSAKAIAWQRLPREALAAVLLMLVSPLYS